MSSLPKVLLGLGLVICCSSLAASYTTTTSTTLKTPSSTKATSSTTKAPTSVPDTDESEETGISHIIKHSKLFTEFVSFAVNPSKSMDLVDSLKTGVLSGSQSVTTDVREVLNGTKTSSDDPSSASVEGHVEPSSPLLQQLFVEMAKSKSPGFVVSFDYLNVTAKTSDGETMFRKPVRMWGILPDELNNKTVYFLADYYLSTSYDAEVKETAQEQIEDFESWKNEILSSGEFSSDKLGHGTIAALLGGGY